MGRVGARSVGGVLEVQRATHELRALLKRGCPGKLPEFIQVDTARIRAVGKVDHPPVRLKRYKGKRPERLPDGMVWVKGKSVLMRIEHPWHGATCYDHYGWGKRGRTVEVAGFAMDKLPVTNEQFAEFLRASRYAPTDKKNFLKHWPDGKLPDGLSKHPVVYVSLDDARAYAKWAGKRLPTEVEWQYAAQGPDGRRWPWGDRPRPAPAKTRGRTKPVGSITGDASPFGVRDLCGHVWQWVDDTYTDRVHTFTVLKGGSFYRLPSGASKWYIHTGPLRPGSHVKVPLLFPSLDRFSTVGFRCVVD